MLYKYAYVTPKVVMWQLMELYQVQLILDSDSRYFQESCKLESASYKSAASLQVCKLQVSEYLFGASCKSVSCSLQVASL